MNIERVRGAWHLVGIMVEQDYVMRMVKEIARALAKILFNKDSQTLVEEKKNQTQKDSGNIDIFTMADNGEINKAENILDDIIERDYQEGIDMGVAFYTHINEFDNEFLEKNNYSREEVKLGMERMVKMTGLSGIMQ